MSSPRWKLLLALTAVGALTVTGCATKSTSSAAAAPASSPAGASGAAPAGSSAAAVASAPGVSSSPDLTIMVGGMSKQIYLPYMLAKQLGYYAKVGINVALVDESAGGDATTNMLAGQVQGVGGFYDHTIVLQGKGKSAESVVSMLQNPGEVELCRTDLKGTIKSAADFKGRSLGITDTGSSTDFLTQYLTTKAGVDPSTTVRRGVGAGQTFLAAMKQKAIDCGMTTEPTVSQAVSSGLAYILLDMRSSAGAVANLGGNYPATSLYMPTDYVNSHKALVQKLVNAYVATLKWIQTHNGSQIADVMPSSYYAGVGKKAYSAALDSEKGIFNPTGLMPTGGPATCLAVLSAFNPSVKGKTIDTSKTFTDEFVKAATPIS
ncbi:NitT/TauT family transport system substrate-binding protein [Nakamurella panacisegetis]|uniref:NitT/TauT family transport system substrate-binding protein n=1 Tax=Nakamurella panacisegetis TaxID=1090615 RepID=A0A1H0S9N8_9ACTN|nr:ABC transporter substrate-binding protein [Nakamurella panacisegetis]SDP37886.1 NitT/TauT family transport system substrate-binding protein [Nakamurella panacisegetis]